MKNTLFVTGLVICVQLLSSCADSDSKSLGNSGPTATPKSNESLGTGDGGGGNAYNGRMLESFIIQPEELPAAKNQATSILLKAFSTEKDIKKNKRPNLYKFKTWYLADMSLKPIDKKILGVEMTQDQLQQVAIQTDDQIWIDAKIFNQMSEAEQARLLIHEVLMSVYLTRFMSFEDICKIAKKVNDNDDCGTQTPEVIAAISKNYPPEQKRSLMAIDYNIIRENTQWLMTHQDQLDNKNWTKQSQQSGFADSRFNEPEYYKNEHIKLNFKNVLNALEKAKLTNNLPTECHTVKLDLTFPCEISWTTKKETIGIYQLQVTNLLITITNKLTNESMATQEMYFWDNSNEELLPTSGFLNLSKMSYSLTQGKEIGTKGQLIQLFFSDEGKIFEGILILPMIMTQYLVEASKINKDNQTFIETCETREWSKINPRHMNEDLITAGNSNKVKRAMYIYDLIKINPMHSCSTLPEVK